MDGHTIAVLVHWCLWLDQLVYQNLTHAHIAEMHCTSTCLSTDTCGGQVSFHIVK